MAVRTNSAAVVDILGEDYDSVNSPSLAGRIETAASMVDDVVACAIEKEQPISSTKAELIERWLAAHFYAVSDKPYTSRSTSGASGSFAGQTAMALDFTSYGQTAQQIDTSGCLAAFGKRQTASAFWMGRPPSAQTDYDQRD